MKDWNRCLWGLLTVLGSESSPPGVDSWWARAKLRPWVSYIPQYPTPIPQLVLLLPNPTLPQLALLAGLVGLQVPWVTLLTCCQLYQVNTCSPPGFKGFGTKWPCLKSIRYGIGNTHITQVGYLAMTTNERMNASRYPRFHTGGAEFYD